MSGRGGVKWTEAEKEQVKEARLRGESNRAIGERMGRSAHAVVMIAGTMGFGRKQRAPMQRTKAPAPRAVRNCLCCRRTFESSGPGNRLCKGCRARDVSPYAV